MEDVVIKEAVAIESVDVSCHPEFKGHEKVYRVEGRAAGVVAFVGVHSTVLGPAEGGIRYKFYEDEDAAITDVLRLSEGMTLKNAAAGLSAGGGKSVIMALEGQNKPSESVLMVLAEALNEINARGAVYYGAQDMNVSEENLNFMAEHTRFIKGASALEPSVVGGNPSPLTALGVFEAMKVAVHEVLGREGALEGLRVSLQGIGSVGACLARLLAPHGVELTACDVNDAVFEALAEDGIIIRRVGLDEIYDVEADVFAPNAVGGTLTDETVERIAAAGVKIVCGAANNQQKDQVGHRQSKRLQELGVLYCPDFIVNAGGIIWVNQVGESAVAVTERVRTHMPHSLKHIIDLHTRSGLDLGRAAEEYALSVVAKAE